MNRRDAMLAALALGVPTPAWAQPSREKLYTVGLLSSGPQPSAGSAPASFRSAMGALGYAEGRNLRIESRYADGKPERFAGLAAELVRAQADVIVVSSNNGALAAQKATASIPIVMYAVYDPVEAGLVKSLARPGGNITGIAYDAGLDVSRKRLAILKESLPALRSVGLMAVGKDALDPEVATTLASWRRSGEAAARSLGMSVRHIDLPYDRGAWSQVFRRAAADRVGAVAVIDAPYYFQNRAQLVEAALDHRMPTLFGFAGSVEAGGLIAYGTDLEEIVRRAAGYVDRVLKGARPADLPVELPNKYILTINLKTARALGLAIPQSVLLQADKVIE